MYIGCCYYVFVDKLLYTMYSALPMKLQSSLSGCTKLCGLDLLSLSCLSLAGVCFRPLSSLSLVSLLSIWYYPLPLVSIIYPGIYSLSPALVSILSVSILFGFYFYSGSIIFLSLSVSLPFSRSPLTPLSLVSVLSQGSVLSSHGQSA